uniref:Uncharacterized protein n=1 Tax=Panagrolaimus sp. JU765 TaxID=591449 RepID=A0AC34RTH1_9BILA
MSDDFSNNQTAKYFPSLANQDYEPAENLSSGDDESKSDDEVAADFKRREAEMLGTEMMDLGAGHFGRPLLEPKIRNYPHPEIQSDDEMELSDGGRSDDDFPSTSKYVEDFSEEFKDVDDFPQNLLTRFYARTNAEHWPISVDPEDDFARLLDCAYYLVVKNVDENAKMLDFLKLAHICFEKLLLGNISRTFTEIQHRNCWLLCAQFLKLFATKLKMAVTSNDANICPLYFAIAFNIFNDNSVFNVLNAKFSAQYMPCHVDDIELMPRYTIYSHDNLFNNEYQQYRMLFYVFAKYDGFDNLKRFIEEVMVYSLNGPQFLLLKVVADFLCAITSFMSEAFSSMTCYLINKSIYLLERATDEEWNYKAIGDFRDSMLLQHLMTLKNLATIVFNKRLMDREDLIRVDNMQLKALLKTIQFAKLAGRTAAIEELQKLLMNVSQPNPSMLMDPTINITRTFEDLIIWIRENDVCGILLRDNLHLLAYIERIERVFDILLKKGKIRTQDLEQMWAASWGKHDVVQRNMIMMISRLAKHLSKELIQRLFELVKASFRKTSAVREKALLLDFIKHLVSSQIYYNNSEIVYRKAFDLTWELYQDPNLSLETIQSLLTTQLLSINNSDKLREECFQKCLTKIKQDCEMVVPLFLHIWHCACETNEKKKRYCTSRLIFNIIVKENIINVFIESLCRYLDKVSKQLKDSGVTMPIDNPDVILIGNNFTHRSQITYRIEGLSHFIVECSERDYYPECSDVRYNLLI